MNIDVQATGPAEDAAVTEQRREGSGPNRRQSEIDRRSGLDRRRQTAEESGFAGPERRSAGAAPAPAWSAAAAPAAGAVMTAGLPKRVK